MSQITITQVVAMFGAYYVQNRANMNNLIQQIYQAEKTASFFRLMPTMSTIYERSTSELGEVLQKYQPDFTPKGDVTFKGEQYLLPWLKVDVEYVPDTLVQSWLGFLAGSGYEKEKYPFIKWFMENHLIPKMKEDFEKAIYMGVDGTVTPGTATTALAVMDGIRKQINDYVADVNSGINIIATGALDNDDKIFVKQIEDFCDQIAEKFDGISMELFMRPSRYKSYRRGRRALYNENYAQVSDSELLDVEDTNIKVVKSPSMATSDKIWMSPAKNRARPVRMPKDKQIIGMERVVRKVQMYTDWHEGACFETPIYIWTNDLDTTP
ncbi:hypothetical protein V9L05_01385 [Bernardetia sp. Wsw4-3y2]|uniref:hypothetical protein n=1 Tax=Bernardetia sp. Wsw4-3y2 TaxID=3127471 RepID=UPI0030CDFE71